LIKIFEDLVWSSLVGIGISKYITKVFCWKKIITSISSHRQRPNELMVWRLSSVVSSINFLF